MNENPQWPIRHILLGIPLVIAISYVIGANMKGWNLGDDTILASATMVSPTAAAYTFLVTLAERSYYMVFWAMEKTKGLLAQARDEGKSEGRAEGKAEGTTQRDREWRAWYERLQAAQREGQPFNEPPPDAPENRNGH